MHHLNQTGLTLVFKGLVDLHAHIPSAPHFFFCIYILRGSMANGFGASGILVIRDESSIYLLYERGILVVRDESSIFFFGSTLCG